MHIAYKQLEFLIKLLPPDVSENIEEALRKGDVHGAAAILCHYGRELKRAEGAEEIGEAIVRIARSWKLRHPYNPGKLHSER